MLMFVMCFHRTIDDKSMNMDASSEMIYWYFTISLNRIFINKSTIPV